MFVYEHWRERKKEGDEKADREEDKQVDGFNSSEGLN